MKILLPFIIQKLPKYPVIVKTITLLDLRLQGITPNFQFTPKYNRRDLIYDIFILFLLFIMFVDFLAFFVNLGYSFSKFLFFHFFGSIWKGILNLGSKRGVYNHYKEKIFKKVYIAWLYFVKPQWLIHLTSCNLLIL